MQQVNKESDFTFCSFDGGSKHSILLLLSYDKMEDETVITLLPRVILFCLISVFAWLGFVFF